MNREPREEPTEIILKRRPVQDSLDWLAEHWDAIMIGLLLAYTLGMPILAWVMILVTRA